MEDVVLAKYIKGCEDCPLYGNDCNESWTSGANGTPREPPCHSWGGEEKIYKCMYSNRDYELTEEQLEYIKQKRERDENKKRKIYEIQEKERLRELVKSLTPYGLSKTKKTPYACPDWFCNRCNRWTPVDYEHFHDGIGEAVCYRCGSTLVCCGSLEENELQ